MCALPSKCVVPFKWDFHLYSHVQLQAPGRLSASNQMAQSGCSGHIKGKSHCVKN